MTDASPNPLTADDPAPGAAMRRAMLLLGPTLAFLLLLLPAPEGMRPEAWTVCAMAALMIVWWVSEAMPLAVTALIPVVVLPTFNLMPLEKVTASFGNPVIFLFLGGFILSAAMQKWQLHTRLGYHVLVACARSPQAILGGLMAVTCFLAMWISNTATMILMLPMALSVAALIQAQATGQGYASRAMVLGVAYASVLGGLASFIGTPTNALLYAHMQTQYSVDLSLGEWMMFGIPTTIVTAGIAWLMLRRSTLKNLSLPASFKADMRTQLRGLGTMRQGERITAVVFFITVGLWLGGGAISDATGLTIKDEAVAMFAALSLFLIPTSLKRGEFTLEWHDAEKIPWGILVFFGGSLMLSSAFTATGVSEWLGVQLEGLRGIHPIIIVLVIVVLVIAASELMSNVATIGVFLPILSVLADALHVNPLLFLLPATLAASCGFMLPGASAPNALAYSTGTMRVGTMARHGLALDIIAALIITLVTFTLAPYALSMDFMAVPEWAE